MKLSCLPVGLCRERFFIILAGAFLALSCRVNAININFSSASGYTVGSLLEGQPSSGTQWVRSTNSGTVAAGMVITSGSGGNAATTQISTGTPGIGIYTFSPSSADLGTTFNSSSSVINYAFSVTYNGALNSYATAVLKVGTGTSSSNFTIGFYATGYVYVIGSKSNWATTTTGGTTLFQATPGTPIPVSGQINFAAQTFTVSINGVAQSFNGSENLPFASTATLTDPLVVQNSNPASANWISTSLSSIQYAAVVPAAGYSVTVEQGGLRPAFSGFGVAQTDDWCTGASTLVPEPYRDTMAAMIYHDLNVNVLRCYLPMGTGSGNSFVYGTASSIVSTFYKYYIGATGNVHCLSEIEAQGTNTLLLMPCTQYQVAPGDTGANVTMAQYASTLAQVIYDLKTTYNVNIAVTGVCNEPTTGGSNWTPQNVVDCVNDLRGDLNSYGLNNVQILAPELSEPSITSDQIYDALFDDPSGAWDNLTGLASHSYNMAVSDFEEERMYGKPYWMTESSTNLSYSSGEGEPAEDDNEAADSAARFLNDLNHSVTQWNWWVGMQQRPNVATNPASPFLLVAYDSALGTIVTHLKYYYFQQMLNTVKPGAVMRRCWSTANGDMVDQVFDGVYGYAAGKPRTPINAAAGLNSDGSWGISLVDDTGVIDPNGSADASHQSATPYNLTVNVQELASVPSKNFTIYRSSPNVHYVNSGTVTMVYGSVTVPIAAKECVCLRSAPATLTTPPAPTGLTAFALGSQASVSWNVLGQPTTWNIERSTSGGAYSTLATGLTTTSYTDTAVVNGTTYSYKVCAINTQGVSAYSAPVSAAPNPSPWSDTDIGTAGVPGSATISDTGTFTVSGACPTGLTGTADALNFMSQSVSGNQTIMARVVREGVAGANYVSSVGVGMRQSLASNAAGVDLTVQDTWNVISVEIVARATNGGGQVGHGTLSLTVPPQVMGADPIQWLKLVRSGTTFTGYCSPDGIAWTTVGTATITLSDPIDAGLVVCNRYSTTPTLCTATFDNVAITTP